MNEGPEIDRFRLDGRASRLRILRWVPLVIAILIMIAFAVLLVIGRESSRPVGQLPGTPRRSPQSHFNPVDPRPTAIQIGPGYSTRITISADPESVPEQVSRSAARS